MLLQRRRFLFISALLLLVVGCVPFTAKAWKKDKKIAAAAQMDPHTQALHALQRLTFGPRPGDMERVAAMGVDKWIDLQLHPDKIDDSALEARLAPSVRCTWTRARSWRTFRRAGDQGGDGRQASRCHPIR